MRLNCRPQTAFCAPQRSRLANAFFGGLGTFRCFRRPDYVKGRSDLEQLKLLFHLMLTSWRSSKFSKDIVPGWFVLFWHICFVGGSVAIAAICNPEFTLGWGSPSLQEPLKTVPWAWQCLLSMHCHKQSHAGVPGVAQNHLTWLLISRCLELYIYIYIYTCFRGLEAALVIVIDIYIYIHIYFFAFSCYNIDMFW